MTQEVTQPKPFCVKVFGKINCILLAEKEAHQIGYTSFTLVIPPKNIWKNKVDFSGISQNPKPLTKTKQRKTGDRIPHC